MQTGKGFGFVFYYYKDPAIIRKQLLHCMDELDLVIQPGPIRVQKDSDHYVSSKSTLTAYLRRVIEESNFEQSEYIRITNGNKIKMHDNKVVFLARTIKDNFPKKTPNYIYIEVLNQCEEELLWNLFQNMFLAHTFHSAYGDWIVGRNEELLPMSGAQAIREVVRTIERLQEPESTWLNLSFLEQVQNCIEGPNRFIGLGSCLNKNISEKLLKNDHSFHYEFGEDYLLLRCKTSEERIAMSNLLGQYLCRISKPLKFWKQSDWDLWQARLLGLKESSGQ